MITSALIRSIRFITPFLLVSQIWVSVHADTNTTSQIIPVTDTRLEDYDIHHPEVSPNDSLMAFCTSKKGIWTQHFIWIQDIASGELQQVTNEDNTTRIGDLHARWSPDMSKLVFTSDRGGETSLYIAELESVPITIRKVKTKPLKASPWYNRVAWTPDSKHIIAAIKDADGDNLYEINVNTHEAVRLSQFTGKSIETGVDLSMDGKTALYVTALYVAESRLESFDLDSKTTKVIQANFKNFAAPTWSPDKKWISFQSEDNGWKAFILPAEGGSATQIYGQNSAVGMPSWTSDSKEIFYHELANYDGERNQIRLTDISAKKETILTETVENVLWKWGIWSPDSRYITFFDGFDEGGENIRRLHVLDIESKTPKYLASASLTTYKPAYKTPVWLSDSSSMISVVNDNEGFPELAYISMPQGTVEILTHSQTLKHSLAISPDDEFVAYVAGDDEGENIWIYDLVLGENYQLTNTKGRKTEPVFSPSSGKLLFHRGLSTEDSEIVVMNIENGRIEKRIDNPGYFQRHTKWLDEETIAFKSLGENALLYGDYTIHSLSGNQQDITISAPNAQIITPNLIHDNQKVIFRNGAVHGNLYIQDIASGETSVLMETNAYHPIVSPDEKFVAYIYTDEEKTVNTTRIWRADLAHIVPPDRLP